MLLTYRPEWGRHFLARMETRLKIMAILLLVVVFAGMDTATGLALGACLLLAVAAPLAGLGKILLKRFLWLFPLAAGMALLFPFLTPGKALFSFWGFTASEEGLQKALVLALRLFNATLAVGLLTATTPLTELLHGFRRLKVPALMVSLMAFTLRYFQLLGEEAGRMARAREARGFRPGKSLFHGPTMRTLGQTLGSLFLRAAGRGDRIYYAMLARGYRGEAVGLETASPRMEDWLTAGAMVAAGVLIRLGEWMDLTPWV